MASATMERVYKELKSLRKDIDAVKHALIPEEKLSAKEVKEMGKIRKEMESGKEKDFGEIFDN